VSVNQPLKGHPLSLPFRCFGQEVIVMGEKDTLQSSGAV